VYPRGPGRSDSLPWSLPRGPACPRVTSYFPDDVSLEPPSPSHSLGSSGSEGCSGAHLVHPWPKGAVGAAAGAASRSVAAAGAWGWGWEWG